MHSHMKPGKDECKRFASQEVDHRRDSRVQQKADVTLDSELDGRVENGDDLKRRLD